VLDTGAEIFARFGFEVLNYENATSYLPIPGDEIWVLGGDANLAGFSASLGFYR
jgi:hypothetical protein